MKRTGIAQTGAAEAEPGQTRAAEPWQSAVVATGHLLRTAGLALASYLFVPVALFTAVSTLTVLGAGVLPEAVLLLRRVAAYKRQRVAAWSGWPVQELYLPLDGPLGARVRTAVSDPATRRELRWLVAHFGYGVLVGLLVPLVWVWALVVDGVWHAALGGRARVLPLLGRLADFDTELSRRLLAPSPAERLQRELGRRVVQLAETRAGALAAHEAELRRIERDLHDGAQARLVALSMRIGLARRAHDSNPRAVPSLLNEAQRQAEEALGELRHVVRGIHPPILTDRGLVGAVGALAAGSGLEVTVVQDLTPAAPAEAAGPRAPVAVEAAAYFVVAEALTNAAKHSGERRAHVQLSRDGPGLRVTVRDEGRGGAELGAGSGLLGIRRRVAALDGVTRVTSPVGGPTVIEVELPCAW